MPNISRPYGLFLSMHTTNLSELLHYESSYQEVLLVPHGRDFPLFKQIIQEQIQPDTLAIEAPSESPALTEELEGTENGKCHDLPRKLNQKVQRKIHLLRDVRSVAKLKTLVLDNIKGKEFDGMNAHWLLVRKIRIELIQAMKIALEEFIDLACSEDCSVTEGSVLDCWTCYRVRAQCFDGSVCGGQDDRDAEIKEMTVYLFLVVQFTVLSSILILCYIFIYHYSKVKLTLTGKEKETGLLAKRDLEANEDD
ncbi:izumo sperm-egg fusion protein 3 [Mixophyes fleayi]|uniref:izumo sperm-egg fusion protein 3 n=1 Tax=Mixophyes fleayi TaxID=3061075 RepID=UPI003F4D7E60